MKDKDELQMDAGLVRDIEAWCKIKFPADDFERGFRDGLFKKAFAQLPRMEIQHVRRISEALCDMDFPTPAALGLRRMVTIQLCKHHDLKKFRAVKMPTIQVPQKQAA